MVEKLKPEVQSSRISVEEELVQLYENPHLFAMSYDGERPQISDLLMIPPGFVVDGTELPEWQHIKGVVLPYRPEKKTIPKFPEWLNSVDDIGFQEAITAQKILMGLEIQYGSGVFFLAVRCPYSYPYGFNSGPVLREDLSRDKDVLREEAIIANREDDFERTAMKVRAIIAKLSFHEVHLAPSWEDIFLSR